MFRYTFKKRDFFIIAFLLLIVIVYSTLSRYQKAMLIQKKNTETRENVERQQAEEPIIEEVAPRISATDLRINEKDYLIVDARSFERYNQEHIRASIHITDFNPENPPRELNEVSSIAIVADDANGDTVSAGLVAELATFASEIVILEGGIIAYKNAGGVIISKADPTAFADHSKITYIEPRDLEENTKELKDFAIIDVRRAGNYEKGHVPGAENYPLAFLERDARNIKSDHIFIYGAEENQTFEAAVLMHDLGFTKTRTINGGFEAWETFGYPLEQE